jgi:hypothetical protein
LGFSLVVEVVGSFEGVGNGLRFWALSEGDAVRINTNATDAARKRIKCHDRIFFISDPPERERFVKPSINHL